MGITYEEVMVGPELALKWLELNSPLNRPWKKGKVPMYARDMQNDAWLDTGESLKFNEQGELIDGQNRLRAVVLANKVIKFWVARDVPQEAMVAMDSGVSRTIADKLIIGGVTGVRMEVGSLVRWRLLWRNGFYNGNAGSQGPTHPEIIAAYRSNPMKWDGAAKRGRDLARSGLGQVRGAGMAYLLFAEIDPDAAITFTDDVLTGANLTEHDPALTARNRLARFRFDKLGAPEQLAVYIRGWNARRANKTLKQLIISTEGPLDNENFPMPK